MRGFCIKIAAFTAFVILLTGQALALHETVHITTLKTITTSEGDITVELRETERDNGVLTQRSYYYPNGDFFRTARFAESYTAATDFLVESVYIPGSGGIVRHYNAESGSWESGELVPGTLECDAWFISTDSADLILNLPEVYSERENGCLEWLPEYGGYAVVEQTDDGFWFRIYSRAVPENVNIEYLYLISGEELIDWSIPTAESLWTNYRFVGTDSRWCLDGYYFSSPESYYPSGENYFRNMPAAYISCSFAYVDVFRAARDMCVAMLDVMLEQQNSFGFVPTLAGSEWLYEDYGIGPGFYDTRFNTDLFTAVLFAGDRYGIEDFREAVGRYLDFFEVHAASNNFKVGSGDSLGWLVEDYWQHGVVTKTHCSLNHQAAEITLLYKAEASLGRESSGELAEIMLRGIEISVNQWENPDGDLHYCYNYSGMFGQDYPYLTYDDLHALQGQLRLSGVAPSSALSQLMEIKKSWMVENKVTGYTGYTEQD